MYLVECNCPLDGVLRLWATNRRCAKSCAEGEELREPLFTWDPGSHQLTPADATPTPPDRRGSS